MFYIICAAAASLTALVISAMIDLARKLRREDQEWEKIQGLWDPHEWVD